MYDGLQQLVDVIGLEASLRLIAAWGGLTLYVPGEFDGDHLITKILGEDAARKLESVYVGQQEHTICTVGDIVRLASSGIDDINTTLAALDVAHQMIAVQSVVVNACRILAERTEGDAVASEWPEVAAWSLVVRSWLVGRLLLPFQ